MSRFGAYLIFRNVKKLLTHSVVIHQPQVLHIISGGIPFSHHFENETFFNKSYCLGQILPSFPPPLTRLHVVADVVRVLHGGRVQDVDGLGPPGLALVVAVAGLGGLALLARLALLACARDKRGGGRTKQERDIFTDPRRGK